MEEKTNAHESIIQHLENFAKTNVSLIKLKAVEKIADTSSVLFTRLLLFFFLFMLLFVFNIGLSLWLGTFFGEAYIGFLVVASFYLLIVIFLLLLHQPLRLRLKNQIITYLLTETK
ncbi:MAG: hypothetical protein IT221_00200 [Fluviicola sp.]|jgi:phosphoglycerol transferase MdoB-like AlkP superfamily enzyme|nr:hypothetical protein [Fluviicola sp.]